jgi:predicted regulator of Ras-like GTPase activity (Roadblock/LC7/MglB family)
MDNLTVNIQANTFLPPQDNNNQVQALAHTTDARLGQLRMEIHQSMEKCNAFLTGRFATIGGWC